MWAREVVLAAEGRTATTQVRGFVEEVWALLDGGKDDDPGPGRFQLSLLIDGLAWDLDVERARDGSVNLRFASGATLNVPYRGR